MLGCRILRCLAAGVAPPQTAGRCPAFCVLLQVFLLTYRAGGAGITLTAGTHIILCEPTLNPSFEKQAIGRSHRMGQTKPLTVTRMLMLGERAGGRAACLGWQGRRDLAGEGPRSLLRSQLSVLLHTPASRGLPACCTPRPASPPTPTRSVQLLGTIFGYNFGLQLVCVAT